MKTSGADMRTGGMRGRMALVVGVLAVVLAVAAARPLGAEEPAGEPDLSGATPRSAMRGFIWACRDGDYERAARYLNLRTLPPARRGQGPEIARELKAVLDRTLWVDLDALSDEPDGDTTDGLPNRDVVGRIGTTHGPVEITVERVRANDGGPPWRISADVVGQSATLWAEFGNGWLTDLMPAPLVEIQFLDVQLWQWIGLALIVVLAALLSLIATRLVVAVGRLILRRTKVRADPTLFRYGVGPLRLLLAIGTFAAGSYVLGLAVPVLRLFAGFEKAGTILALAWLLLRLTDVLAHGVAARFAEQGKLGATAMVPLGRRTLKIVVTALAAVAMLQAFGFNVTGVIAGLGVGGLAVALAAQKTVENLFGGVTLVADQPVRVGDFCRFGDRVGVVEDIGLRSTRVRTLERTVVSIPNADFSAMQIENFARRDRIWLHTTIGLRYETTPEQLRGLLDGIQRLLLAHPRIDPNQARAHFVGFGTQSLDVEIFAYVRTIDFDEYLAARQEIFLGIIDLVAASGTRFGYPGAPAAPSPISEPTPDGNRPRPGDASSPRASGA